MSDTKQRFWMKVQKTIGTGGVMAGKKRPRCACGYADTYHCAFDEPGVDHALSCVKMHHEFRPRRQEDADGPR